jgi:hypothetical protein
MIDKINIVSQNYFKSNCKDLREEMETIYEQLDELLRTAYMKGYSDGAEKMKMCLKGTTNE